jgi:hypothetical protein
MRRRAATLITVTGLLTSAALAASTGMAAAAARPGTAAVKELDLAGYHFTVGKSTTSLSAQAHITAPKSSCGSGGTNAYAPEVVVHYRAGTSVQTAEVTLACGCFSGSPIPGYASLEVGSHSKTVANPLSPGQTVTITVTAKHSGVTAKIAYSKSDTASLSGAGGSPSGAQFSVALPSPPRYSPIKFSQCTGNGKKLSSFHPGAWEGVNSSGKATGKISKLSDGTNFTVSY